MGGGGRRRAGLAASALMLAGLSACGQSKPAYNDSFTASFEPADVTAPVGQIFSSAVHFQVQTRVRGAGYELDSVTFSGIHYAVGRDGESSVTVLALTGPATHSDLRVTRGGSATLNDPPAAFKCLRSGREDFDVLGQYHAVLHNASGAQSGTFQASGIAACQAVGALPTATTAPSAAGATTSTTTAPPSLSPITATFVQSAYSTYYEIKATNPAGLSYQWSVSIPTDPGCAAGFKGHTPSPNGASWYHQDEKEGGPCNHSGADYSPAFGHPGTVTVIVTSPEWSCTASYHGTLTGTGSPPQCTRT